MDTTKLEKANQLKSTITSITSNLDIWKKAIAISEQIKLRSIVNNSYHNEYVNNDFIDFEILRSIMVGKLTTLLEEKQIEFNNL